MKSGESNKFVYSSRAFTLIELVLVITIIGVTAGAIAYSMGGTTFWKEEAFIRKLSETITFLHHQAVVDQEFYELEIDLSQADGRYQHAYHVGVLKPEEEADQALIDLCSGEAGSLSCELSSFLSPSLGKSQTLIPPPGYPSLWEPVPLPEGSYFEDIRTMRGKRSGQEGGKAYILFSPRGFSEFSVIHVTLSGGNQITILVNPFTGTTEIFREYKDFEWAWGKKKRGGDE